MATYHVIFRACDRVIALHGGRRPFGLDRRTLAKICFLSLVEALEGFPHRIQVIGDRLSDELLEFFGRFPVGLVNAELSNALSLARAIEFVMQTSDNEWVYLCEDDYLHHPNCFRNIDDLIEHRMEYLATRAKPRWRRLWVGPLEKRPLFIFPPDYPDRYQSKRRKASFLFHSRYCHWRQVDSTTGSFIGKARDLKRRARVLRHFAATTDDRFLSRRLYRDFRYGRRGLCLSPIPGLSSHLHERTLSVLGDWEAVARHLRERLETLERTSVKSFPQGKSC